MDWETQNKMSVLLKLILRFNPMQVKILAECSVYRDGGSKIYKEKQYNQNRQNNSNKE